MIATLVDWGLLAQAVYVSVVVGIGVLVVAAFGVSRPYAPRTRPAAPPPPSTG